MSFFLNALHKLERQHWQEYETRESAMLLSPEVQDSTEDSNNTGTQEDSISCGCALASIGKPLTKQADLSWQPDQARSKA